MQPVHHRARSRTRRSDVARRSRDRGSIRRADGSLRVDPGTAATAEVSYVGKSTALGRAVFVEHGDFASPLRLRQPELLCGYAWGRRGSMPREVGRAILAEATGNEILAERLCRPFTWEVIAELPASGFRLTRTEVLNWVEGQPEELDHAEAGDRA
jgi:hypothetical protein